MDEARLQVTVRGYEARAFGHDAIDHGVRVRLEGAVGRGVAGHVPGGWASDADQREPALAELAHRVEQVLELLVHILVALAKNDPSLRDQSAEVAAEGPLEMAEKTRRPARRTAEIHGLLRIVERRTQEIEQPLPQFLLPMVDEREVSGRRDQLVASGESNLAHLGTRPVRQSRAKVSSLDPGPTFVL